MTATNGVERTTAIRAKLEDLPLGMPAPISVEEAAWLVDEIEWLRTAYVVHCRQVALANPAPPPMEGV